MVTFLRTGLEGMIRVTSPGTIVNTKTDIRVLTNIWVWTYYIWVYSRLSLIWSPFGTVQFGRNKEVATFQKVTAATSQSYTG